jgi:hypothetical protein
VRQSSFKYQIRWAGLCQMMKLVDSDWMSKA